MISIVILLFLFALFTALDATVLYYFLRSTIADQSITPAPDSTECIKYTLTANTINFLLRLAGSAYPVHLIYYGYLFYNKYALNIVATVICLILMTVVNSVVFSMLLG